MSRPTYRGTEVSDLGDRHKSGNTQIEAVLGPRKQKSCFLVRFHPIPLDPTQWILQKGGFGWYSTRTTPTIDQG